MDARFQNFIIEVKGRFDDLDKEKARRGHRHCELLTEFDKWPGHYILLLEDELAGPNDIPWWGPAVTEGDRRPAAPPGNPAVVAGRGAVARPRCQGGGGGQRPGGRPAPHGRTRLRPGGPRRGSG